MSIFSYATSGSFIGTGLLTESEGCKLFIINKTSPYVTTADSFTETQKSTSSGRRSQNWVRADRQAVAGAGMGRKGGFKQPKKGLSPKAQGSPEGPRGCLGGWCANLFHNLNGDAAVPPCVRFDPCGVVRSRYALPWVCTHGYSYSSPLGTHGGGSCLDAGSCFQNLGGVAGYGLFEIAGVGTRRNPGGIQRE
jgi:hypothetical protein